MDHLRNEWGSITLSLHDHQLFKCALCLFLLRNAFNLISLFWGQWTKCKIIILHHPISNAIFTLSFRLRIVEILNFCNMVPLIYFASARTRAGHPNRHTHQRIRPRLLPANTTHFVFWLSQTGSRSSQWSIWDPLKCSNRLHNLHYNY